MPFSSAGHSYREARWLPGELLWETVAHLMRMFRDQAGGLQQVPPLVQSMSVCHRLPFTPRTQNVQM